MKGKPAEEHTGALLAFFGYNSEKLLKDLDDKDQKQIYKHEDTHGKNRGTMHKLALRVLEASSRLGGMEGAIPL